LLRVAHERPGKAAQVGQQLDQALFQICCHNKIAVRWTTRAAVCRARWNGTCAIIVEFYMMRASRPVGPSRPFTLRKSPE
jgi:hypothetical protein